jgi:hypothetical protein
MSQKVLKVSAIPYIDFEETIVASPEDIPIPVDQVYGYLPAPTPLPNVALSKTTAASSNAGGIDPKPSPLAVDGSLATAWFSEFDAAWPRWWSVDLDATYRILRFELVLEGGNNNLKSFEVQWSADNTSWTTIYSITDNPIGAAGGVIDDTLDPPVPARYWRVLVHENNGDTYSRITEARFYGYVPVPLAPQLGDLAGDTTTTEVVAIGGVPIAGAPDGTNNTFTYDPTSGHITWLPGGTGGGGGTGFVGLRVRRDTNLVVPAASTPFPFETVDFDTSGFIDLGVSTTRITIPAGLGGKYIIGVNIRWELVGGDNRLVQFFKNGTTRLFWNAVAQSSTGITVQAASSPVLELAAGDYIDMFVNADATTTIAPDGYYSPTVTLMKVDVAGGGGGATFEGASVYASAAQNLPSANYALVFDTEHYDTGGYHDPAVNPSRLTVPAGKAGKYHITGGVRFTASSSQGRREAYIRLNGTTDIAEVEAAASTSSYNALIPTITYDLAAGDYVELVTYQDTGVNIPTYTVPAPFLQLELLNGGGGGTGLTPLSPDPTGSYNFGDVNEFGQVTAPQNVPSLVTPVVTYNLVSQGRPGTASSDNGSPAANALDGDDTTRWITAVGVAPPHWIYVDLGSEMSIGRWVVRNELGDPDSTYYVHDFQIQYSHDAASWASAASVSGNTSRIVDQTMTPVMARYWRLYITAPNNGIDNFVRLAGFEVYQAVVTGPTVTGGTGAGVRASQAATTTIPSDTWTALALTTTEWDTNSFHSDTVNPSRFTVPIGFAGKYIVTGSFRYSSSGAGSRYIAVRKNGTVFMARASDLGSDVPHFSLATLLDLVAGDYIELVTYQNSGSSQTIDGTTAFGGPEGLSFAMSLLAGAAGSGAGSVAAVAGSGPVASSGGTNPIISWNPTAAVPFNKQQLQGAAFDNQATAPGTPVSGQIYLDTATSKVRAFIAAAWQDFITSITALAGDVTGTVGATVLPAVGTAGTYAYPSSVTTDAKGRVAGIVAGSAPVTGVSTTGPIGNSGTSLAPNITWNPLAAFSNNGQPVSNFVVESLAVAPTGAAGRIYSDTALNKLRAYLNSTWQSLVTDATALAGDVTGTIGATVLPAKGTAGTYAFPSQIITDAKGAVTGITAGNAQVDLQGSSPGTAQSGSGRVTGSLGADTRFYLGSIPIIERASSFPASPVDGQRFWHTTYRSWFDYISADAKWRQEHPGVFDGSFPTVASADNTAAPKIEVKRLDLSNNIFYWDGAAWNNVTGNVIILTAPARVVDANAGPYTASPVYTIDIQVTGVNTFAGGTLLPSKLKGVWGKATLIPSAANTQQVVVIENPDAPTGANSLGGTASNQFTGLFITNLSSLGKLRFTVAAASANVQRYVIDIMGYIL